VDFDLIGKYDHFNNILAFLNTKKNTKNSITNQFDLKSGKKN